MLFSYHAFEAHQDVGESMMMAKLALLATALFTGAAVYARASKF
jgi:hypothetical protein